MLASVKFEKQVQVYGHERYSDEAGFMGKKIIIKPKELQHKTILLNLPHEKICQRA